MTLPRPPCHGPRTALRRSAHDLNVVASSRTTRPTLRRVAAGDMGATQNAVRESRAPVANVGAESFGSRHSKIRIRCLAPRATGRGRRFAGTACPLAPAAVREDDSPAMSTYIYAGKLSSVAIKGGTRAVAVRSSGRRSASRGAEDLS